MPTSRKRIGFLPTAEVQNIINKISAKNNLSQSKVTGILVEEALKARNLFNLKRKEKTKELNENYELYEPKIHNEIEFMNNNLDIAEDKEYKLIKEYLNYKIFKKMLLIAQSES